MTLYFLPITTDANNTNETKLEVKGDVVTKIHIRFPPGPQGLLSVRIFYGIKQIWPQPEENAIVGDNEVIEWEEYWPLPESPCTLIIKTENKDDTYAHTVYIAIAVMKKYQTLPYRLMQAFANVIRRMFGVI